MLLRTEDSRTERKQATTTPDRRNRIAGWAHARGSAGAAPRGGASRLAVKVSDRPEDFVSQQRQPDGE